MPEAKTTPTPQSAEDFLAQIDDPQRRQDCQELARLMQRVTGMAPVMWGPSIVGFGSYRYHYASGRSGESCATGFSPRKADISIYLLASTPTQQNLLSQLGRHKMGKSCLSIRRLADIDLEVLEHLIGESFADIRRRHTED